MGGRGKHFWLAAWLCLFGNSPALAESVRIPECEGGDYAKAFQEFENADPKEFCRYVEDDACTLMNDPADASDHPKKVLACQYAVRSIAAFLGEYKSQVALHCSSVKSELGSCGSTGEDLKRFNCVTAGYRAFSTEELDISKRLQETSRRIGLAKSKLEEALAKFRSESTSAKRFKCGNGLNGKFRDMYIGSIFSPPGLGNFALAPLVEEIQKVQSFSDKFSRAVEGNVKRHEDNSRNFLKEAKLSEELAKRFQPGAGQPQRPRSDITGGEEKKSAGGGGSGGGSGAGSGGGKGDGQPSGGLGQAAATAPTPDALKGATNDVNRNPSSAAANGRDGAGGKDAKTKLNDPPSTGEGGFLGGGVGTISASGVRGDSSLAMHAGLARARGAGAASASVKGGSGSPGFSGSDGIGEKHCMDRNCQAISAGASPFASVGSLGSSALGGGMAGMDPLPSFDGGGMAAGLSDPSLRPLGEGTLGGLDGAMGSGDGALAELQGSSDGGVGSVESGTLFARARECHERAQKRGLVIGLKKRL